MSRQVGEESKIQKEPQVPFVISLVAGIIIAVGIAILILLLSPLSFIAGALILVTGLLALGERVITLRGHIHEQLWFRHPIWHTTEILIKSLTEWLTSGVILIVIGAGLMIAAMFLGI